MYNISGYYFNLSICHNIAPNIFLIFSNCHHSINVYFLSLYSLKSDVISELVVTNVYINPVQSMLYFLSNSIDLMISTFSHLSNIKKIDITGKKSWIKKIKGNQDQMTLNQSLGCVSGE